MIYKSYTELIKIESFEDRLKYLSIAQKVGEETFGYYRYINQRFYSSDKWKSTRREVIIRDNGCDLAHNDYIITGSIYIHHINPIDINDILEERPCIYDLNNLVCSSFKTHNAIHYNISNRILETKPIERKKYDTCPWR